MHVLEVYWNRAFLEQIIGRASRYCSHKGVPEDKRIVRVYIYIATHPSEKETVDQYIKKLAYTKDKLIEEFNDSMKESAIDCNIFKSANVYRGDNDIICEK